MIIISVVWMEAIQCNYRRYTTVCQDAQWVSWGTTQCCVINPVYVYETALWESHWDIMYTLWKHQASFNLRSLQQKSKPNQTQATNPLHTVSNSPSASKPIINLTILYWNHNSDSPVLLNSLPTTTGMCQCKGAKRKEFCKTISVAKMPCFQCLISSHLISSRLMAKC